MEKAFETLLLVDARQEQDEGRLWRDADRAPEAFAVARPHGCRNREWHDVDVDVSAVGHELRPFSLGRHDRPC